MDTNGKSFLRPTDELVKELMDTVEAQNGRKYRRLMKEVDWTLADADQLNNAMGTSVSFVDLKPIPVNDMRLSCQRMWGRLDRR
ncbi:MAG: hypothetical protein AAF639_42490 [Chloroflexota bacterium]